MDSKLDGGAEFDFNQTSAIPVVQIDDVINNATVNNISIYDPIANVGVTNPNPESHQVAFWADTSAGEIDHQIFRYEGADRGFMCDRRKSYNPDAAKDAWQKMLDLFSQKL